MKQLSLCRDLSAVLMVTLLLTLPVSAQVENVFTRGNVNDDFQVNERDLLYLQEYLFGSGPDPLCMDAADINDDGSVDPDDYTWLQTYFTGAGAPPLPPFPNRGWDPSPDLLTCFYPTPAFPAFTGNPSDNIVVCISPGSQ